MRDKKLDSYFVRVSIYRRYAIKIRLCASVPDDTFH
jgi:hypothetical protein